MYWSLSDDNLLTQWPRGRLLEERGNCIMSAIFRLEEAARGRDDGT